MDGFTDVEFEAEGASDQHLTTVVPGLTGAFCLELHVGEAIHAAKRGL
jgi:hypothetical protein